MAVISTNNSKVPILKLEARGFKLPVKTTCATQDLYCEALNSSLSLDHNKNKYLSFQEITQGLRYDYLIRGIFSPAFRQILKKSLLHADPRDLLRAGADWNQLLGWNREDFLKIFPAQALKQIYLKAKISRNSIKAAIIDIMASYGDKSFVDFYKREAVNLNNDPVIRHAAIKALGDLGARVVVDIILNEISRQQFDQIYFDILAAFSLDNPKAMTQLLNSSRSQNPHEKLMAQRALMLTLDRRALPSLYELVGLDMPSNPMFIGIRKAAQAQLKTFLELGLANKLEVRQGLKPYLDTTKPIAQRLATAGFILQNGLLDSDNKTHILKILETSLNTGSFLVFNQAVKLSVDHKIEDEALVLAFLNRTPQLFNGSLGGSSTFDSAYYFKMVSPFYYEMQKVERFYEEALSRAWNLAGLKEVWENEISPDEWGQKLVNRFTSTKDPNEALEFIRLAALDPSPLLANEVYYQLEKFRNHPKFLKSFGFEARGLEDILARHPKEVSSLWLAELQDAEQNPNSDPYKQKDRLELIVLILANQRKRTIPGIIAKFFIRQQGSPPNTFFGEATLTRLIEANPTLWMKTFDKLTDPNMVNHFMGAMSFVDHPEVKKTIKRFWEEFMQSQNDDLEQAFNKATFYLVRHGDLELLNRVWPTNHKGSKNYLTGLGHHPDHLKRYYGIPLEVRKIQATNSLSPGQKFSGQGITLVLAGDYFNPNNQELSGRIRVTESSNWKDFTGPIDPEYGGWEDTALATIIAGANIGLAPQSRVWAIVNPETLSMTRQSWDQALSYYTRLFKKTLQASKKDPSIRILGIPNTPQWVFNQTEIKVIKGTRRYQEFKAALDALVQAKIIPVVSRPNGYVDLYERHLPGSYSLLSLFAGQAIVIGSAADPRQSPQDAYDDEVPLDDLEQLAKHKPFYPDLLAPKENLVSEAEGDYRYQAGTAHATAYAMGVIALILQANPNLNLAQVKTILSKTAQPLTGFSIQAQGAGQINPYAAVGGALYERLRQRVKAALW